MRSAPPLILVLIAAGALAREEVLGGEYWRLVSAMFLHGGFGHLLGNCLVLYIVGMACEHALGLARTAVVYFASGAAGSLLSLAFREGPSVGASGAIFGVAAAVIVVLYRHQGLGGAATAFFMKPRLLSPPEGG